MARQHDDGNRLGLVDGFQPLTDLESVYVGHLHVQDDQVGVELACHLYSHTTVIGYDDVYSLSFQQIFYVQGLRWTVFDHQNDLALHSFYSSRLAIMVSPI